MGGQSAGPQHTEAETVRGAAGLGLGKGPGRNGDGHSGARRSPPAPQRGSPCRLLLRPPFSRETPEFFPFVPSAAPTAAARPGWQQRRRPREEGSVQGAAREGVDPGQRRPDRPPRPSRPRASPASLSAAVSSGPGEPEVLPLSRSGMGLRGRLGLKPSCWREQVAKNKKTWQGTKPPALAPSTVRTPFFGPTHIYAIWEKLWRRRNLSSSKSFGDTPPPPPRPPLSLTLTPYSEVRIGGNPIFGITLEKLLAPENSLRVGSILGLW